MNVAVVKGSTAHALMVCAVSTLNFFFVRGEQWLKSSPSLVLQVFHQTS